MLLSLNILGSETIFSWIPENLLRLFFYRDLSDLSPPSQSGKGLFTETPMVNNDVLDQIRSGRASVRILMGKSLPLSQTWLTLLPFCFSGCVEILSVSPTTAKASSSTTARKVCPRVALAGRSSSKVICASLLRATSDPVSTSCLQNASRRTTSRRIGIFRSSRTYRQPSQFVQDTC